jgi:hypothetical protein
VTQQDVGGLVARRIHKVKDANRRVVATYSDATAIWALHSPTPDSSQMLEISEKLGRADEVEDFVRSAGPEPLEQTVVKWIEGSRGFGKARGGSFCSVSLRRF